MASENLPVAEASNPLLMEEIPQTLDQLNAKIAELFHCMVGPPQAFFEIPLENGVCEGAVERLVYVSLVRRTDTAREGAEARLVMAMLEPFIAARRQLVGDKDNSKVFKPLLFWRKTLEIYQEGHETRIRCRVVIPGADLDAWEHYEGEVTSGL